MSESLTARERIRNQKDFDGLYKNGSRFRGRYFNLVYRSNQLGFSRVGVVVSKKVGPAVTRNRVKRSMRELFRRNKALLAEPTDLIIVTRPEILTLTPPDLAAGFFSALAAIYKQRT